MTPYNSFTEIDERLRILKSKRQIDKESLKLHFGRAKSKFYPSNLVGGFSGMVQKIALSFAIKRLSNLVKGLRPQ